MPTWNIYYREREYAREHGDPLLGTVTAWTKDEAERKARSLGLGGFADVIAIRARSDGDYYTCIDDGPGEVPL